VKLNIGTKVEAGTPEQTAPREQFVAVDHREIKEAGMLQRVSIQSSDWGRCASCRSVNRCPHSRADH
jgi:glycerophosphoryl diester phosphodiesterase